MGKYPKTEPQNIETKPDEADGRNRKILDYIWKLQHSFSKPDRTIGLKFSKNVEILNNKISQ